MVIARSSKLVTAAQRAGSKLLADVFTEAEALVYTSVGYNCQYSARHWRSYSDAVELCAQFVRDAKMCPELNVTLSDEINYMCSV